MQSILLFNFVKKFETRRDEDDFVIWIPFERLREFTEIIGYDYFSEDGHEVVLQYEYIAFDLSPILEYLDIDPFKFEEELNNA